MSCQIRNLFISKFGYVPEHILDATANAGGNTIAFTRDFRNVTAFEIKSRTCAVLQNNIQIYNLPVRVQCRNFLAFITAPEFNPDIIFIDPPWFLNERFNDCMVLETSRDSGSPERLDMIDIIFRIWKNLPGPRMIAIKVPRNFRIRSSPDDVIHFKKMDMLVYYSPELRSSGNSYLKTAS
jgi:predicted RNA methylase